jgi:hypothetical protein
VNPENPEIWLIGMSSPATATRSAIHVSNTFGMYNSGFCNAAHNWEANQSVT